jgi:hypothetical protein
METRKVTALPIFHSAAADLSLLPKAAVLWLTWKQPVASPVIQEVYGQLFRQMQLRVVKNILIDTRLRGRASEADEIWMMQEFVPQLIQQFGSGLHLAYLIQPAHYLALKAESPNGSMESLSDLMCMNYFQSPDNALGWLSHKMGALSF